MVGAFVRVRSRVEAKNTVFLQDSQLGAGGDRQTLVVTFRDLVRSTPNGDSVGGLELFGGFDQHGDYHAWRVPPLSTDFGSLNFSLELTEMFPLVVAFRQVAPGHAQDGHDKLVFAEAQKRLQKSERNISAQKNRWFRSMSKWLSHLETTKFGGSRGLIVQLGSNIAAHL